MIRIVVAGRPVPRQPGSGHPVLGEHQVEHGADQVLTDTTHRHAPCQRLAVPVDAVEARQRNEGGLRVTVGSGHCQCRRQVAEIEVPLSNAVVAVTEAQRPVRHGHSVAGPVEQHRLESRVLDVMTEIGCGEVLSGHKRAAALFELHQEGKVGVAAHIVDKERNTLVHEGFRQDDVTHRHGQCPVGARRTRHPLVGELGVVGVVGAHAHHLGPAVADLGHPVRIGRAGDRDVGAPHHQIRGVPPVPGFRHVGLVAEHLRRCHRQVGVPVVERRHRPAEQFDEPRSRRVADHRHRRDRREAGDPVGAIGLDGVHMRCGDHLGGFGPGHPDQPALAAGLVIAAATLGIGLDVRPRQHRIAQPRLGLPVHLHQHTAAVGVAHPGGRVGVPGERSAARAAAGLVLRTVRAHRGVIGLLGFPGDDAVLDVDLPRA